MRVFLLAGFMTTAAAAVHANQDQLDAAKNLYASAAYEEALSTLSRLSAGGVSAPDVAREVDEYRAFCLYALGRTAEAEAVAESLIRREPLAELSTTDTSPRLEAMFVKVKKRVLPGAIRDRYRTLRALLDEKKYAAAEPGLAEVRQLLTVAEQLGGWDDALADLSILIDGFLALSRAHVETAGSVAATPVPAAGAPPPLASSRPTESALTDAARPPAPTSAAIGAARLFSAEDADVRPPLAISQNAPAAPLQLLPHLRKLRAPMILKLAIDETGSVTKASLVSTSKTVYDDMLVRTAGNWKYKPAMRNGVPVKYEKSVVIEVK